MSSEHYRVQGYPLKISIYILAGYGDKISNKSFTTVPCTFSTDKTSINTHTLIDSGASGKQFVDVRFM